MDLDHTSLISSAIRLLNMRSESLCLPDLPVTCLATAEELTLLEILRGPSTTPGAGRNDRQWTTVIGKRLNAQRQDSFGS
jgi:hypothetical protein